MNFDLSKRPQILTVFSHELQIENIFERFVAMIKFYVLGAVYTDVAVK